MRFLINLYDLDSMDEDYIEYLRDVIKEHANHQVRIGQDNPAFHWQKSFTPRNYWKYWQEKAIEKEKQLKRIKQKQIAILDKLMDTFKRKRKK